MNQNVFLILSFLISFSSCTCSHNDLLSQSKKKISSSQSVKYRQSAHYPNPMGDIDTSVALIHFNKSDSSIIGNDFIYES